MNAGRNLHDWGRCDPWTCLICEQEFLRDDEEADQ